MHSHSRTDLLANLRALQPGQRVRYRDWRGGTGEGTFLRFVDAAGREVPAAAWGGRPRDVVIVKRDFSADDGRIFRPLLGDGDVVEAL